MTASPEAPVVDDRPGAARAAFTRELAAEIRGGAVELPGFPHAVLQVQRLLNDERADVEQIAQAVSLEPALAVLVLRMANSAAYSTTARPVRELRVAVQRIGSGMVRAAAIALVVQSLRNADELRVVRELLQGMWRRGVAVGAIGRVLARRLPPGEPDAALLAGLLHVMGRLFVLTRLARQPALLDQQGVPEALLDEWGGRAAGALLHAWDVPQEYTAAVLAHGDPERTLAAVPDLADVLGAAVVLADLLPPSRSDYLDQMQLAQVYLQTEALWRRLGLSRQDCSDVLHSALDDVQQLRVMFGA